MFTPLQLAFMKGFLYALGRQKKKLAQDDAKWITVHPNGQGHKGRPALIDTSSGEVLGGMGGKFNGRHISAVKRGHEQAGAQMNVNRMNHKADMMNNQKIGFTNKTSKDIEKQKIAERSNEYMKRYIQNSTRANEAKSLQKAVKEASLVLQKKSSIAKPDGYEERKKAREASLKRRVDLAQQHADTMQRKVEEAGKKWDDEWQYQKETGREFGQPNVAGRMNSAQNALQRKQDAYMNAKQEAEKAQYRADNIKHADYKIKGSGERARGDLQDRIYDLQQEKKGYTDAVDAFKNVKTKDDFYKVAKSLNDAPAGVKKWVDYFKMDYFDNPKVSDEKAIRTFNGTLKAEAKKLQTKINTASNRLSNSQANSSVSASTSSFNTRLGDVSFAKNNKGESLAVLKTNGVPSKEDRAMLKSRRFRWNPDLKAWTVKATEDQSDFIKNFIG